MPQNRGLDGIKECTAWLEKDDATSREMRAARLHDIVEILPVPSKGISFFGGWESSICFDEVRRCYMDGSYIAVVLLCLAYVERELAASLYAAGWEPAKNARLAEVLEKAYDDRMLSTYDWQTYSELASLRNSHAHFRTPGSPTSLLTRTVEEEAFPREVLAKDAKLALQAMARIVRRQGGTRVTLGPSVE